MAQQDLIWVRLPFSDMEGSKIRPAVIVSNNSYNEGSSDVVVCAITSNLAKKDYSITISQGNLSGGKLPIRSRIRADKILQIEKNLVTNPFARLDDSTFNSLTAEIIKLVRKT